MYESYQEHPREHKSHLGIVLITLAIIVAAIAGFFILSPKLANSTGVEDPVTTVSSGIVYDDAAEEGGWEHLSQEEIEANLNQKVADGMINISMNTAPVFADGTAEGNIMVVNETINNYPQKVEFIRNDTEEVIYSSNAIPVGSKIERAALDVDLEPGTYECTALFHNLDPETGSILGTAGAVITITIQN